MCTSNFTSKGIAKRKIIVKIFISHLSTTFSLSCLYTYFIFMSLDVKLDVHINIYFNRSSCNKKLCIHNILQQLSLFFLKFTI